MKQCVSIYDGTMTDQDYDDLALASEKQDGLMSKEDKKKLNDMTGSGAGYTHPDSHPATMITEDTTHKFITDEERTKWNAKASVNVATSTSDGLMTAIDKKNLDYIKEKFVYNAVLNGNSIEFLSNTNEVLFSVNLSSIIPTP